MIGPEPLGPGEPDEPLCVPFWYVTAYDPEGEERGMGAAVTLAAAAASAWILSHSEIADQFGRIPLSLSHFDCVPRHVPDGWTFEVDNMQVERLATRSSARGGK
jgi:hypothetical protein